MTYASERTVRPRTWLRLGGAVATALGTAVLIANLGTGASMAAAGPGPGNGNGGLSTVPVPQPIGGDIVNQAAAVRLGKALFWDEQVGGDGQIACATCHFHAGADNRAVAPTSTGVVGSQGIAATTFVAIGHPADSCGTPASTRSVTGRNAPSVLNAVFNRDNFWDGRANHNFNRTDPFGATTNQPTNAGMVNGPLVSMGLIGQASLASQADGPPDNKVEMSCDGRAFNGANSLAAKMLSSPPLAHQQVSPADGVLGGLANPSGPGLAQTATYKAMIDAAFGAAFATDVQKQNNFTSIFGQAIQAYESTLVSDQTPFDSFSAGNRAALTTNQQAGMSIFQGKGQCSTCHSGIEMTDASWTKFNASGALNSDGGDQGFHNLGVRPTAEDLGRANTGPGGVSFSASGSTFDRGAFKTPGLRNVGLTAPYFHTGSKASLADVVAFYARGGDFANPEKARTLRPQALSASEQAQLVDFLQNGLTDCRVAKERAPFDHPSLAPPNGTPLSATGASGIGSCP